MAMPEIRDSTAMGNEAVGSSRAAAKYLADISQYASVVKQAGIPPAD